VSRERLQVLLLEGAAAGEFHHPRELRIGRGEDAGERASIQLARVAVGRIERALLIDLQEGLAILPRASQLSPLVDDDGPRHDRECQEDEEHELNDPPGLEHQAECIDAREASPHGRPDDDAHTSLAF
jgi:hypothetical protein